MILVSVLIAAVALVESVAAHGYVPQIKIGNQYIPGWNVPTDPYTTPQVNDAQILSPRSLPDRVHDPS